MRNNNSRKVTRSLEESLLAAVWRQWAAVGAMATTTKQEQSQCVIDPEALILVSLHLIPDEPRLADLAVGWAILNSDLLSVQRMNNLKGGYPDAVRRRLAEFAKVVHDVGKDARWKPLFDIETEPLPYRDNKIRSIRARFDNPPALLLRLRGIFGLGIRPDVVAFLMCKQDPKDYADTATIAEATGYSKPAVKRILDTLVEAGALSSVGDIDPGYAMGWGQMFTMLDSKPDRLPRWRYCHQTFVLVIEYLSSRETFIKPVSDFMLDVQSRKFIERHKSWLIASEVLRYESMREETVPGIAEGAQAVMDRWF